MSLNSDSHSAERAALARDPSVSDDPRARNLILDPQVPIESARELVEAARRLSAGYRREGFGSKAQSAERDALDLAMGTAHIGDGGVTWDGVRQVFGAPVVVRN